jgi:hypothetical protein
MTVESENEKFIRKVSALSLIKKKIYPKRNR